MRWAHRRTVTQKNRVDAARVEETYLTYGRNHEAVRSFLAATESIRDPRLGQRLSQLEQKVLILWGSEDRLVPRKVINALETALRASESHVHIGGGHHLQEDEPVWVAEKIDSFFSDKQD
jgi:pimeloyl-ACP methyl ester carboxylesterase